MQIDRKFLVKTALAAVIVVLVVVGALILWYGRTYFLLAFAGLLMALTLRGAADWLSDKTRAPAWTTLPLLITAITGVIVLLSWLAAPNLVSQIDRMVEVLPQSLEQLEGQLRDYSWGQQLLETVPTDGIWASNPDPLARVTGVFSTTLGFVANVLIILFLGLFIAISPGHYFEGVLKLVPMAWRPRAKDVLAETAQTLRRWVVGRLVSMLFVGLSTGVILAVLGVPLALSLATVATLLTFVPYLGPITSAIPTVLIALFEDPMLALWVLVAYTAIQMVEGYILTPIVQSRAVSVPPALLLSGQVLFGLLFGLLGVVLATPVTAAALVLVRRFYVEDALGDRLEDHAEGAGD